MHGHRQPCRVALALTAFLLAAVSASAQGVGGYVSIVERYLSGDPQGAVEGLYRWSDAPLTKAIDAWMQQMTGDRQGLVAAPQALRAAVMLHTDLAYILLATGHTSSALTQTGHAVRLVNGLIAKNQDTAARTFAIQWYAFVTSMYTAHGALDAAQRFVRDGLTAFPQAAELYVARGSIQEMRADMEGALARDARHGDRPSPRAATMLETAAADCQRALDLNPHLDVAHLHRGWIHYVLDDGRAAGDLASALDAAGSVGVRYLAHLFLGAVAERHRDFETGRREFEAARAEGSYQSAYVALGRIEAQLGHDERSRAIAREFAQLSRRMDDPWWDYRLGGFNANALAWLRAEARHR